MPLRSCHQLLQRVLGVAEVFQVELHGRYSHGRVHELATFVRRTTRAQAAIVLFGTAVPCLIMPFVVDLVQLTPPTDGPRANWLFFLREFLAWWFFSALCINQSRHYVSSLWLGDVWLLTRAGVVAAGMAGATYFLAAVVIGFPVPFTNVITSPVWVSLLCCFIFYNWHGRIQTGAVSIAVVKQQVITWFKVWGCQCCLLSIYPAYFCAFISLPQSGQLPFACLLPVLKVLVRNWLSRALGNLRDELTESVILNADVFSSLFVSYCMQTVPSGVTTAGLMVIDFLQLAISTRDLSILIGRINALRRQLQELQPTVAPFPQDGNKPSQPVFALPPPTATVIELADALLAKRPDVGGGQNSSNNLNKAADDVADKESIMSKRIESRVISGVKAGSVFPSLRVPRRFSSPAKQYEGRTSVVQDPARIERQLVDATRRLLYFTEFLLLLSYVEVIIPFIYAVFLMLANQLPNQQYYAQFQGKGSEHVFHMVSGILFYGFMEFVSFVMLEVVLVRQLGTSGIVQLAFLLQKQVDGVQTKLLFWVFYFSQAAVQHLGYDYTFTFPWLHTSDEADSRR